MSLPNPAELLPRMASDLRAHLAERGIERPRFVGIHTGGIWVAEALLRELGNQEPLGTLDVSFYRDDFTQNGLHPQVRPSALPFEIDGQHLVLVDDVLMSGRTIRAALDALADIGRPDIIQLAVLVDRGHRQVPIRADYVGKNIPTARDEDVTVYNADIDGRDAVVLTRFTAQPGKEA